MIRTDIAYEIVDLRDPKRVAHLLGTCGVVTLVPGGFEIKSNNYTGLFVDVRDDEDDSMFEAREDGSLVFNLPEGTIFLEPLRLTNYRERVLPFIHDEMPVFYDDAAVQAFFYPDLRALER